MERMKTLLFQIGKLQHSYSMVQIIHFRIENDLRQIPCNRLEVFGLVLGRFVVGFNQFYKYNLLAKGANYPTVKENLALEIYIYSQP